MQTASTVAAPPRMLRLQVQFLKKSALQSFYMVHWVARWLFRISILVRLCKLPALLPRHRGCCICRYKFSKVSSTDISYSTLSSEMTLWESLPAADDVMLPLSVPYEMTVKTTLENFNLLPTMSSHYSTCYILRLAGWLLRNFWNSKMTHGVAKWLIRHLATQRTIWNNCKADFWENLPAAYDVISLFYAIYDKTVRLKFENFVE